MPKIGRDWNRDRGALLKNDPVAINEVHVGITRNKGPKSKCEEGQQTPRTWQCTILDVAGLPSHSCVVDGRKAWR